MFELLTGFFCQTFKQELLHERLFLFYAKKMNTVVWEEYQAEVPHLENNSTLQNYDKHKIFKQHTTASPCINYWQHHF